MPIKKDMIGKKIGMLLIVDKVSEKNYSTMGSVYLCNCDCGEPNLLIRYRRLAELSKKTNIASCGCVKEKYIKRSLTKKREDLPHGESKTTEYRTWTGIKKRCHSPLSHNYNDYGGKGITVCNLWLNSYKLFLKDMGRKPSTSHSIDRIDNNKGYYKENCRWSTSEEQANNKSNNRRINYKGADYTAAQLYRKLELKGRMSLSVFYHRLDRDSKSIEDILKEV